jgi:SpoVK/Ycf46/Vps4 family AAA+-type ATPase
MMDEAYSNSLGNHPVLIGTTNRPSEVDPCFRRGGRMEIEIDLTVFSVHDRLR